MTKTTFIIISTLFFSLCSRSQDILSGKFQLNEVLNEYMRMTLDEKVSFKKNLKLFNIKLATEYLKATENDDDKIAAKLKNKDTTLAKLEERVIAGLYTLYEVYRIGLLDNYCITLESNDDAKTKAIYLSADQLEQIKPSLGKDIKLKVKYCSQAKLTGFKIYKLADN